MRDDSFVPVTLARIVRPWGRRGEVAAEILTDFPQRLTQMREAWLSGRQAAPRLTKITSCRIHLGQAVFKFQGVDTISDAETLRGLEVQVPLAERVPTGPDRYYVTDLIGCEVWEVGAGAPLGTVEDVHRAGEHSRGKLPESCILAVATPTGELLIPLAAEICTRIDLEARRIDVRLPEGLRELNTP